MDLGDIFFSSSVSILLPLATLTFMKPIFRLTSIFKILEFGLYFADVVSDIQLAIFFYLNCHYLYCLFSSLTLLTSYVTTVIFLFRRKLCPDWKSAVIYPYFHFKQLFRGVCNWEKPEEMARNRVFSHQITFIEATSESTLQLFFSVLVIRQFGVCQTIQIASPLLSIISLYLNFVKRHILTLHEEEPQLFSRNFGYSLVYWLIPTISVLGLFVFYCFETYTLFWPLLIIVFYLHPITHVRDLCCQSKNSSSMSNNCCTIGILFCWSHLLRKTKKYSVIYIFSFVIMIVVILLYFLQVTPITSDQENASTIIYFNFEDVVKVESDVNICNITESNHRQSCKNFYVNYLHGEGYLFLWILGILPSIQCFIMEVLPSPVKSIFKPISYDCFIRGPKLVMDWLAGVCFMNR